MEYQYYRVNIEGDQTYIYRTNDGKSIEFLDDEGEQWTNPGFSMEQFISYTKDESMPEYGQELEGPNTFEGMCELLGDYDEEELLQIFLAVTV